MDTPNFIKVLRYFISSDATIQSLLGENSATNARKHIVLFDSTYASIEGGYDYPRIGFLLDDESPILRGSDDNQIPIMIQVVNSYKNANSQITNLRIKDRLKTILDEKHIDVNNQASDLGLSMKIRNIFWVSGTSYDDKTQGSERLHKFNCIFMITVGD